MAAISPMQEDVEFDHGTFDSAAFTTQTLASWQNLAGVIDQPGPGIEIGDSGSTHKLSDHQGVGLEP